MKVEESRPTKTENLSKIRGGDCFILNGVFRNTIYMKLNDGNFDTFKYVNISNGMVETIDYDISIIPVNVKAVVE